MGMVLSANMPWITAMEVCARYGLAPFDPDRDYISKEKWIGTSIYNMSCGKGCWLFITSEISGIYYMYHNLY